MNDKLLSRLWYEEAALVSFEPASDEPRKLVRQEPLWKVLNYLDALRLAERLNLTISFPDRHVAPTRLDLFSIEELLRSGDRPGHRRGS